MMSVNLLVSLIAIVVAHAQAAGHGWNYKEQGKWPGYCQKALLQSPIDLDEDSMTTIDMKPFIFNNWDYDFNASMTNNGHSVQVMLFNRDPMLMRGGGLPGTYKLEQFHFHWGAEHTIKGERQALEAHFVTYNTIYESLKEAVQYRDGIAVLGVLYEESHDDNVHFKTMINNISKIKKATQKTNIRINPKKLMMKDFTKFYRYAGSLTTPDCNDVVKWTVFSQLATISSYQVKQFASIRDGEGKELSSNYRELQSLNGRPVFQVLTPKSCCD